MGRPLGQPVAVVAVTAGTAGTYGVVAVAAIAGTAGLIVKYPHALAHTCQSIPAGAAWVESFATAAMRLVVAAVCIREGSEGMKFTASVSGLMAIGVELMATLGSAADVAVSVTDVPADVTGGAVYIVAAPLAVWFEVNHPHPPGAVLLHCTCHATPPGATSLATVTLTGTWAALTSEVGGACVKESESGCGGAATIVVTATAALAGEVAAEEAVIVTMEPDGTVPGAV